MVNQVHLRLELAADGRVQEQHRAGQRVDPEEDPEQVRVVLVVQFELREVHHVRRYLRWRASNPPTSARENRPTASGTPRYPDCRRPSLTRLTPA